MLGESGQLDYSAKHSTGDCRILCEATAFSTGDCRILCEATALSTGDCRILCEATWRPLSVSHLHHLTARSTAL